MYEKVIRILSKGYLPISLLLPSKLQEILSEVKKVIQKMNPEYGIVIKRLHLYYDMKLVTFGIDGDKRSNNSISHFGTAIYPTATNMVSNRNSTSSHCRSK